MKAWSLDRRQFLQAALAATAVATTRTGSAKESEKLRLRKAVKYSMIGGNAPILEKFQIAKEAGFEGVDMNTPADHDEVNAAAKGSGLIVHGVVDYDHWRLPLSDNDPKVREQGLQGLLTALRDCKAYDGTSVLLVPAVVNKNVSYADAYKNSQAEIRKALPLAAELQIPILFENVWNNFLLSPLETARYIDEFESPWVGCYFDVGNVVRYGWPEHWIHTLGKRIGKLDIKEYSRKIANEEGVGKGFRAEIGQGEDGCDWPAVLKALKDIGYSGWATAEVGGGDLNRLKQISQLMDAAFEGYGS